jgi:hypothetical protein
MKNNLRLLFGFLLLLLTFGVNAQTYTAKSSVNTTTPELNEKIEVTYELYAKGNSVRLNNPKFGIESNEFKGFKIEQHGQPRGGMMFDMGSRNGIKVFTYKYILKPTSLGKQTIPGLTISFKGKEYKTKPIIIKVLKEFKDNSISSQLELRFTSNKSSCYIGETVRYDLYYYSAYDIWDISLSKVPEFNGFIAKFLESKDRAKRKKINGTTYNVQKIGSYILTPTKSGLLKIPPVGITIAVRTRRGMSQQNVNSKAKTFKVKALPLAAPKDFDGLVGEYRISQKTDKKVIVTNDAVTSRITITGSGNLASMQDIAIKYPSTFEALPPTNTEKINSNSFGYSGVKTFEFIAIPRQPGRFEIPSIEIPFFNTKTKKYQILKSKPIHIKVTGKGISDLSSNYNQSNKETVTMQGSDIRYLKNNTVLFSNGNQSFYTSSTLYYILSGLGILCFFIGGFIFKERTYSNDELKNKTKSKANKIASKKLQAVEKLLKEDSSEFHAGLDGAMSNYLKGKLMLEQEQMDKQTIKKILIEKNIPEALVEKTIKIQEQCKMARFSPLSISKNEMFADAKDVINQLENLLK